MPLSMCHIALKRSTLCSLLMAHFRLAPDSAFCFLGPPIWTLSRRTKHKWSPSTAQDEIRSRQCMLAMHLRRGRALRREDGSLPNLCNRNPTQSQHTTRHTSHTSQNTTRHDTLHKTQHMLSKNTIEIHISVSAVRASSSSSSERSQSHSQA